MRRSSAVRAVHATSVSEWSAPPMMPVSGSDGLTVARVPPERWQGLEDWDAAGRP